LNAVAFGYQAGNRLMLALFMQKLDGDTVTAGEQPQLLRNLSRHGMIVKLIPIGVTIGNRVKHRRV
jgi:hypothetical protein